MTAPAAFQATFSDFRIVKGRKVAQIVIETPLEQADAALAALGGLPMPDRETWVAVARLAPQGQPAASPAPAKRAFHELDYVQQAALKSADPAFIRFMLADSPEECADLIRRYCGVSSRSEIVSGATSGNRWKKLLRDFEGFR